MFPKYKAKVSCYMLAAGLIKQPTAQCGQDNENDGLQKIWTFTDLCLCACWEGGEIVQEP